MREGRETIWRLKSREIRENSGYQLLQPKFWAESSTNQKILNVEAKDF